MYTPVLSQDTQWNPLSYLELTDFIDDVQECTNHFLFQEPCPSPPLPPLPPPPMNPPSLEGMYPMRPFQSLDRYIRDTRPCQQRTRNGMSSVEWSDRIQAVHEYRKSSNPDR
jgi:hypothetical protein